LAKSDSSPSSKTWFVSSSFPLSHACAD
jgi:hypothetical protein